MGYYWEVALVLNEEAKELFDKHIDELDEDKKKDFNNFIEKKCEIYSIDGCYLYYWDYIKWFKHIPEVEIVERFIDLIESKVEDELLDYYFITIGESYNDVSIKGDFYINPFNIEVLQQMRFDKEKKEERTDYIGD